MIVKEETDLEIVQRLLKDLRETKEKLLSIGYTLEDLGYGKELNGDASYE